MILDKDLMMSESQAVTVTAASTNVIDQGAKGDAYEACWLVTEVKEDVTAAGAATVNVKLEHDSDEAFGTVETVIETGAIAKATLVEGYQAFKVRLPQGMKRYIRVSYEVATGPLTAGKFSSFLVKDVDIALS